MFNLGISGMCISFGTATASIALNIPFRSKDEIVSIDAAKNWFSDSTLARKEFFEVNVAF